MGGNIVTVPPSGFPPDELRRFEIRSREFGVSVHPQALRIGVLKQKRKLSKVGKRQNAKTRQPRAPGPPPPLG